MKSLFWKEWRENRFIFVICVLTVLGSVIWASPLHPTERILWAFPVIFFFAGYFGAGLFIKEKDALEFLFSIPVERKTIFLVKWLTGILNIFVLLAIALALEMLIYKTNGFNFLIPNIETKHFPFGFSRWITIGILSAIFLYYNITFFLSSLFATTKPVLLMGLLILFGMLGLSLAFSNTSIHLNPRLAWIVTISQSTLSLIVLFIAYRIFSRKEAKT